MADELLKMGLLIGLIVRYGQPRIQAAVEALAEGRATPKQQKICFDLLQAIRGEAPHG
jgi:hypothetical protein